MKYFELRCIAYIKKDIEFKNSFDVLSKFINFSMLDDDELKLHHEKQGFKNYTFGGLYPIEKEKIYKKGQTYTFTIRSLDQVFINKIDILLRQNINSFNLQVVETTKQTINKFFIISLYSVTPVIVSLPKKDTKDKKEKQRFWSIEDDVFALQKQLQDNLLKKYKSFYGEELETTQNFIQLFEIKNRVPQSIYFTKNFNGKDQTIRLFGNKFRFIVNEDEVSQKLAFVALACGLGEKQSYGGGFVLGKGMRL